jgi:hypothetical protein
MEQAKALQLLSRQVRDIQAQAEKLIGGENSSESIESFARYSLELKSFIEKNIESDEIRKYLSEIPEINYQRTQIKLWQYLIFPSWWISLYKGYQQKNEVLNDINIVRGKYATLDILVRSAM